jgi:hypothetical protein
MRKTTLRTTIWSRCLVRSAALLVVLLSACGGTSGNRSAGASSSPPSSTSSAATSTTTAASPPADPISGDYNVRYATSGSVAIHASTDGDYTISVTTPFEMVGATCSLPISTVLATFSGTSPSFHGTESFYDPTTCAFRTADGNYLMHLNSDGTLTSTYNGGESHLFTKVSDTVTSNQQIGGAYRVTYATPGAVSVSLSAATYTIAVTTPFKFYGSTCAVPAGTVIATFTGTSPSFHGTESFYHPTTCAFRTADGNYLMHLNTDGTLTSTYNGGESHLFTPA